MGLRDMTEQDSWKAQCAEQERIIELCNKAFELIPTKALERGYDWLLSPEGILTIKVAKDAVRDYLGSHYSGGNAD